MVPFIDTVRGLRSMTVFRLMCCLVMSVLAFPAFAEKRVALVIGNGAYQQVTPLKNARNDGTLIAESFRRTGFEVTEAYDLDEDAMGVAVDAFLASASQADVAAVYYAGHGVQVNGENYLVPVDAKLSTENALARDSIALSQLTEGLTRVPIALIFLDACRDNPFVDLLQGAGSRSAGGTRGLAVVRPEGDMLVAFATLPNTTASDGTGRNSPFAVALSRHIPAGGAEVSVMMKRVTADVMAETGGAQRPQQLTQMQKEFYFVPGQSDTAPKTEQEVRSLLSVYPARVTAGEEISIVSDIDAGCRPAFFALSAGGKITLLPAEYFAVHPMHGGQTRYEISPGSQYALVVEPEDEKGVMRVGYFCDPGLAKDDPARLQLLRDILVQVNDGVDEGTSADGTTPFQSRPVEIF